MPLGCQHWLQEIQEAFSARPFLNLSTKSGSRMKGRLIETISAFFVLIIDSMTSLDLMPPTQITGTESTSPSADPSPPKADSGLRLRASLIFRALSDRKSVV